MKTNKFSLKSRLDSFKYAFNGIIMLLKNEHNSRIHFLAAFIAILAGFLLKIDRIEWVILVVVIGIVFLAELFNTSLETISDIVNSELNESIRNAKDYSAAAVLMSAIISIVAGAIIFTPKILDLFK
jgi:diacylglycerol kinase (ATP)